MNPEIRGLTDSMSGVTRDEGSQPGTWECNVEFINESEFQVRLEDVKVTHKIPSGSETLVSETPNKTLTADETWDFDFDGLPPSWFSVQVASVSLEFYTSGGDDDDMISNDH